MPEKITSLAMTTPSSKCNCCPYGFHIDRDFVRFCDTLYNSTQLEKLRQYKKEKRKENKTVESYLGLGNIALQNKKEEKVAIEKCLPCDPYLESDDLKNAVNDFEDTWQRSLKKSSTSNDIPRKQRWYNSLPYNSNILNASTSFDEMQKETEFNNGIAQSCSSSSSSISSQTASSTYIALVSPDDQKTFLSTGHPNAAATSLSKPNLNTAILNSGAKKSALTAIRQQMASCLSRMKELEEEVKSIPLLQDKLSVLTEENKHLLNQLQFNQHSKKVLKAATKPNNLEIQLKRLENQGITSPTLTRKCLLNHKNENNLISPVIASELDAAISKKHFIENEIISQLKIDPKKDENPKILKSIGTSCSVLTRDIGTSYIPNKKKSVAVGCDTLYNIPYKNVTNGKYVDVSSESIESDLESVVESDELPKSPFLNKTPLKNVLNKRETYKSCSDSSTSMNLVYSHKSTNTDPEPILFSAFQKVIPKPSMRSKYTQVTNFLSFCDKSVQTLSVVNYCKSTLTDIKRKSDIAVGDFDINEITCSNCKNRIKSISDETLNKNVEIEKGLKQQFNSVKQRTFQTKTIAVGDDDINEVCKKCKQDFEVDLNKKQIKSVEITKANENASIKTINNSDILICDKCSAAIHTVARGLAANSSDSKIPKFTPPINKTKISKFPKLNASDVENDKKSEKSKKTEKLQLKISKDTDESNTKSLVPSTTLNSISSPEIKMNEDYNEIPSNQTILESSGSLEELPTMLSLAASSRKKAEISKEIKAACKVLNDCLQKSDKGKEKKALSSLAIIQNEWFKVANQKNADPLLIEDYLDLFEEFSKLLLERVVNLADNNGNTALHYAVSYGNFDVVSILIDSKVCDVNKKNKAGYTSIMLVALADIKNDTHQYVIQRLFSIGDINTKATQNGQTALMLAVSHGKKEIVKTLLSSGTEINLQDKDGSTALMCAAEHGHIEIVKLLLSYSECDPTIIDNDNCNALTIAMEAGHKDIGLLIYTSMNFSRGNSPSRKRSTPRSTPPPRTPTLRTPPLPSPSAKSTNSIPSSFHFSSF